MHSSRFLISVVMSIVLILLCGCSTTAPEDALSVTWTPGVFNLFQEPSFYYNGTDYSLLDDEYYWLASKEDMCYLGMLLTGGVGGNTEPITLFGFPIISSYEQAFGYFEDNSENPLVIASERIWLKSSVDLSPGSEHLIGSYIISIKGIDYDPMKLESIGEFPYSDILQNDFVLSEKELDTGNRFCLICFYLRRIPCLYCPVSIYEHEGYYYAPASIGLPDWKTDEYVRLNDEWQELIMACAE